MMLAAGHAQPEQAPVIASKILNFEIGSNAKRFGKLEFVGGLQLESEASGFGGFSGLRLYPDRNALMAVSDRCMGTDRNAGAGRDRRAPRHSRSRCCAACLWADQGKPLAKSRHTDCEALEIDDGDALIAFERNSQTGRFEIGSDGALDFIPRGLAQAGHRSRLTAIAALKRWRYFRRNRDLRDPSFPSRNPL